MRSTSANNVGNVKTLQPTNFPSGEREMLVAVPKTKRIPSTSGDLTVRLAVFHLEQFNSILR